MVFRLSEILLRINLKTTLLKKIQVIVFVLVVSVAEKGGLVIVLLYLSYK